MLPHIKAFLTINCIMLLLWLHVILPVQVFCQDTIPTSPPLVVGVTVLPPACMKTADNQWEGFSVEIWQAVAEIMDVPFVYREFKSLGSLLAALEKKEIDLIPSLAVQDRLEATLDFSQSFLKSGLAIAVPAGNTDYKWIRVFESICSPRILKAVVLMILMSLIFGIIVWLLERRRNSEMFDDAYAKGVGDGIWWAMVTMSTVGYGDKSPKTMGGRIVAFIWMVISIIFIAAFTAAITSELTIGELRGKVRGFNDLYNSRVGCVRGSEGCDFLTKKGVTVIPFQNVDKGLLAMEGKRIDAFVQDGNMLSYLAKSEFPGRVQVIDSTFDEYFVSIAIQQESPLREPINNALLKLMKTERWHEILNRYIR